MKDYETRGDNLSNYIYHIDNLFIIYYYLALFFFVEKNEIWSEEMIRQICCTYFGTRRNAFKSSPEKSKAIKINNRRNNRTLKVCINIKINYSTQTI